MASLVRPKTAFVFDSLTSILVTGRPMARCTLWRPSPKAWAVGVRLSGSMSSAARRTSSSSGGASARPRERMRPRWTRMAMLAAELSPMGSSKGLRPVTSVHVVEASAHTSCWGVAGLEASCCSGGAHRTENPSNAPASSSPLGEATPKSARTGWP